MKNSTHSGSGVAAARLVRCSSLSAIDRAFLIGFFTGAVVALMCLFLGGFAVYAGGALGNREGAQSRQESSNQGARNSGPPDSSRPTLGVRVDGLDVSGDKAVVPLVRGNDELRRGGQER